jgi:aminoglycoside phosphotransferase (APT) family kinase protein
MGASETTLTDARIEVDAPQTRKRLERFLASQAGAQKLTVESVSLLSGGTIQENWSLGVAVHDGPMAGLHQWVLRTGAPAAIAASLTRAQEFAVLRVAHAAGVTVPKPLWACTDPGVIGREFFVMEKIPGISAGHRLTRDAELVPDGAALAHSLGESLGRLHAIRPPRPELNFLPLPHGSPALDSVATYRGYLDEVGVPHPVLEWGLRWCELNSPATGEIRLIHRDYRTGNYLVHQGKLTGVLDWEFAGWGDPREDIGWFMARCWRFAGVDCEAGGIAAAADFLRGYESTSGQRYEPEELAYWQVMAHLRWAVIALQQAQRHLSGAQPSLELALTGYLVPELEMQVLALIRGAGIE